MMTETTEPVREPTPADDRLWSTSDVCTFTGWGRTYIQRLVSSGQLPYIPGKPHKFIPASVKAALEKMQTGGVYGRRKSKTTTRKGK